MSEHGAAGGGGEPGFDVFLSHNSQDKPAVRELCRALQDRGLSVWLDEDELRPGLPWQPGLESGIRASRSVTVLVGADGLGPWEIEEMQAALMLARRRGIPVIPVLLPDAPLQPAVPLFLELRTWVDLRPRLTDAALDRLQWGITGVRPGRSGPSGGAAAPAPGPALARPEPAQPDPTSIVFEAGPSLAVLPAPPWSTWIDFGVRPKTAEQLDAWRREAFGAEAGGASESAQRAGTAHELARALRNDAAYDEAAAAIAHAERLGRRAIELDRGTAQLGETFFAGLRNTLGTIRLAQCRLDDAAAEFLRAIAICQEKIDRIVASGWNWESERTLSAWAHRNLGCLRLQQGRYDEAVQALQQAIALDPSDPQSHRDLARALHARQQLPEAAETLARAAALEVGEYQRAADLFQRGLVLVEGSVAAEALSVFSDLGVHQPGLASLGKGVALRQCGRLDESAQAFAEAIDADPESADAHGELGVTLWRQGRFDEGVAALRRAAALTQQSPVWAANLGIALASANRPEEARVSLARALAIDPKHGPAQRAVSRLTQPDGR